MRRVMMMTSLPCRNTAHGGATNADGGTGVVTATPAAPVDATLMANGSKHKKPTAAQRPCPLLPKLLVHRHLLCQLLAALHSLGSCSNSRYQVALPLVPQCLLQLLQRITRCCRTSQSCCPATTASADCCGASHLLSACCCTARHSSVAATATAVKPQVIPPMTSLCKAL